MRKQERIQRFVAAIWDWYAVHKRTLPWRDLQIADPDERAYRILVSEVMLQQTQVPRVIPAYRSFLERFPTLASLAAAGNAEVLLAWRGMGYNRRALQLRDTAKGIVQRSKVNVKGSLVGVHQEERVTCTIQPLTFPTEIEDLIILPGIGRYTAAAIRNFAFGIPTPCIDTNIRRILHRTFVGPEEADGSWRRDDSYLLKLAEDILSVAMNVPCALCHVPCGHRGAAAWHAALMDFGSLVQTKRNPRWDVCPLTAQGIMKTTPRLFERAAGSQQPAALSVRREPGRFIGSRYIPNRIFRGRIVEALRDAESGLDPEAIGKTVCIDWKPSEHRAWLQALLRKLVADRLLKRDGRRFVLHP